MFQMSSLPSNQNMAIIHRQSQGINVFLNELSFDSNRKLSGITITVQTSNENIILSNFPLDLTSKYILTLDIESI